MRIRSAFQGALVSLLVTSGLLPGCGKEKTTPGLMLSFTSDMSVPKDVTAVGLYIRTKTGGVIYNNVVDATIDPSGNRTVRFPSTFAILSNGSAATVRIQLIAYGRITTVNGTTNRKALVMRESTTGVPTDRLSLLRMPLLWINQGSVAAGSAVGTSSQPTANVHALTTSVRLLADEAQYRPDDGYKSPCGDNQSWIGGKCRTIDPNAPLPDFTDADKPGVEGSVCFSVESCFATPTSLRDRILEDGSLDIGATRATALNLALITKDDIGIKLPDGRFAISLDSDSPFEGFTIEKDRIVLSDGVREALRSGRATDLIATTECGPKTIDIVNCGPWNPASTNVEKRPPIPIGDAGGTPSDAGGDVFTPFDGGAMAQGEPQGPSEPQYSGLALSGGNIFAVRDGMADGGFPTSLRVTPKGAANSTGIGSTLASGPYRVANITFGSGANVDWANKSFVFAFTAAAGGHIYRADAKQTAVSELPVPAGAIPVGVFGDAFPVFVARGGSATVVFGYPSAVSQSQTIPLSSPFNPNETPTTVLPTIGAQFLVATTVGNSAPRVRQCSIVGGGALANCDTVVASASQGIPVDLARDTTAGTLYALVVRDTGTEQGYEGIYELTGGSFVAQAIKSAPGYSGLHFEPAGTGANAGTLPRNRMALGKNSAFGYVTTAMSGGTPSQVMTFDRTAAKQGATVVAGQMVRALDIEADETHVYYNDFGSGNGAADGRIYRLPQ